MAYRNGYLISEAKRCQRKKRCVFCNEIIELGEHIYHVHHKTFRDITKNYHGKCWPQSPEYSAMSHDHKSAHYRMDAALWAVTGLGLGDY